MPPIGTDRFIFLANHPGLDFINTRMIKKQGPVELLETPRDLLQWMFAGYLITAGDYAIAEQHWLDRQAMAEALADALRLRDAVKKAVEEMILRQEQEGPVGKSADQSKDDMNGDEVVQAVRIINEYMAVPAVLSRLSCETGDWRLQDYAAGPEGLVPLIARQASRVFTDLDRRLIKKCRNEKCSLCFYDISKNQARAWCSMDLCGNRAKAAKHYQREMPS